jgi:hypothetical protein
MAPGNNIAQEVLKVGNRTAADAAHRRSIAERLRF